MIAAICTRKSTAGHDNRCLVVAPVVTLQQ
jgi:hypothetical protein